VADRHDFTIDHLRVVNNERNCESNLNASRTLLLQLILF